MSIRREPPDIRIHWRPGLTDIRFRPAKVDIENRAADIDIDWRQVWSDIGAKSPSEWARLSAQKNREQFLEGLARKAAEGDRIGNLAAHERNVYGDIAFQRFLDESRVEWNIGVMPEHRLSIRVTTYRPVIRVETHRPEIDFNPQVLSIEVSPGFVDIDVRGRLVDRSV